MFLASYVFVCVSYLLFCVMLIVLFCHCRVVVSPLTLPYIPYLGSIYHW